MILSTKKWLHLSLINLSIVALLGTIMRFKIGFEFPYLDQKFLQHGHSHFAFVAWISQTLFVLITHFIQLKSNTFNEKKYNRLLWLNTITGYGILISFILKGYSIFSISFLTLNTIIAYRFAYTFFKDFKLISSLESIKWFKSALIFNVISSFGTFYLAYMLMTKQIIQNAYLASVYFYLHFQYNAWFIFACIGLLIFGIQQIYKPFSLKPIVFYLFISSCVPAYFLSVLWLNLPISLYIFVIIAAICQLLAWLLLFKDCKNGLKKTNIALPKYIKFTLLLIAMAYTIKLVLQLGSTVPFISTLAFGFRPIVIAYLHLVLLGVISMFLLTYIWAFYIKKPSKTGIALFLTFAFGVYLNEIGLAIQGIASFSYTLIPGINEFLFGIAALILASAIGLAVQFKKYQH